MSADRPKHWTYIVRLAAVRSHCVASPCYSAFFLFLPQYSLSMSTVIVFGPTGRIASVAACTAREQGAKVSWPCEIHKDLCPD